MTTKPILKKKQPDPPATEPDGPEIIDFSDAICELQVEFNRTGYSWNHERVLTWLHRHGAKTRYDLPIDRYYKLIDHLREQPNAVTNP